VNAVTRRARPRTPASALSSAGVPDLFADFGREQLAVALETSGAVLRGFEAARAIQQRAAADAAARHRHAAHDLRASGTTGDALSIPFALWQADIAAATQLWQALFGAALEAQTEALACACAHVFDSESGVEAAALVDAVDRWPVAPASRSSRKPRSRRAAA
jgi:hypothetical protein